MDCFLYIYINTALTSYISKNKKLNLLLNNNKQINNQEKNHISSQEINAILDYFLLPFEKKEKTRVYQYQK